MKKIKGLIAPIILFLMIIVGILFIVFWKADDETDISIDVKGNRMEKQDIVLENDSLKFVMDSSTTHFKVTDKKSGKVWYSNPEAADEDPLALKTDKNLMKSTLFLTSSNLAGSDVQYNNFASSIEKQSYEIETGTDYVKVSYSIGNMDKEYRVPAVITQKSLDSLLEKLDDDTAKTIKRYYKKYDVNKLGKLDDMEELIARYPVLESEPIYTLRNSANEEVKILLEQQLEAAGYTNEQYEADKLLDAEADASKKQVFNVSILYSLDEEDLMVSVPMNEIEYSKDTPVIGIAILPYFGAGGSGDNGFMLVPEGGGSLIRFNNGKTAQNRYYTNLYGWDMATDRENLVHETRAYFNAFGISHEDSSLLCVLEEGAPYANVQADISGKGNSYNSVYAGYTIVHEEKYDIGGQAGTMVLYEEKLPEENLVQRYRFVDSGDYVDMAEDYRNYLLENYGDYLIEQEDTEAPFVLEILGAADKVKQILGVPVSKPLKLTDYTECVDMLKQLQNDGIQNMFVKLSGWMNGGVNQKILKDIDLIQELGGKKEFRELETYVKENGIRLYLDGITQYAHNSKLADGFMTERDVAKQVSEVKAELNPYSDVDYGKATWQDSYYLLKPDVIDITTEKIWDFSQKHEMNVSFRDTGMELSSDLNPKDPVSRQEALQRQKDSLKKIHDSGTGIMINMGNDYALPYCDMVTNMDLKGSEYGILDETVPFYQMAIHGLIDYTGESLNISQDYDYELLQSVEYGAGLSFTFMQESSFALQNTMYTKYFGAEMASWYDKMIAIYGRYNEQLGHTFNQKIIDHKLLRRNLSCTTYEDGTRVYVNYNYKDMAAEGGVTVPARDYLVIR